MKILVAGFGNVLREDDGFGVLLAQRLETRPDIPEGVDLLEAGIGGISMVQDLMLGYDALIVLDALEEVAGGDDRPGKVKVMNVEVADAAKLPKDYLADVHYAEPGRAMVLAKALGALPEKVYLIGAVAESVELGEGLGAEVEAALQPAEAAVLNLIQALQAKSAGQKALLTVGMAP